MLNDIMLFVTGFGVAILIGQIIEVYKYYKGVDSNEIDEFNVDIDDDTPRDKFIRKATAKINKFEAKRKRKEKIRKRVN